MSDAQSDGIFPRKWEMPKEFEKNRINVKVDDFVKIPKRDFGVIKKALLSCNYDEDVYSNTDVVCSWYFDINLIRKAQKILKNENLET